jgi:hypothetical protein
MKYWFFACLLILGALYQNCSQPKTLESLNLSSLSSGATNELHIGPTRSYKTVAEGLTAYRLLKSSGLAKFPFTIWLHEGHYEINETINLNSEDSGTDSGSLIFKNFNNEIVTLSGANIFKGATLDAILSPTRKIWIRNLPTGLKFEDLYVNGRRVPRAATKDTEIITPVFEPGTGNSRMIDYFTYAGTNLANIPNLEIIWNNYWMHRRCPISSINYDSALSKYLIYLTDECLKDMSYTLNTSRFPSTTKTHIENALELLDTPEEWFYQSQTGKLYYYPRSDDSLSNIEFRIPILTELFRIDGATSIVFDGVIFEDNTLLTQQELKSFVNIQATVFPKGPELKSLPAAISLKNSSNITFQKCKFRNLASTAIKAIEAVQNFNLIGNHFYKVGASAIQIGEVTKPIYYPAEAQQIVSQINISNNLIEYNGTKIPSSPSIFVGYAKKVNIVNNLIRHAPYSGISIGWGWGRAYRAYKNALLNDSSVMLNSGDSLISGNYITDFMNQLNDGGGVYTLDALPNTIISKNLITQQHQEFGALYLDNCSRFVRAEQNVIVDNLRTTILKGFNNTIQNNYWRDSGLVNGIPDIWVLSSPREDIACSKDLYSSQLNQIINNIPITSQTQAPEAIVAGAGLESTYSYLKNLLPPTHVNFKCLPAENKVILSWDSMPGANLYLVRLDNPLNNSAACTGGWNCDSSDHSVDTPSNQAEFSIVNGKEHKFWVHSASSVLEYSTPSHLSFTCN